MTCACCDDRLTPASAAQARTYMRTWRFYGNQATTNASGQFQLIAMTEGYDNWAASMVLGGFGLRRWHGIELNAAGLALWQEVRA